MSTPSTNIRVFVQWTDQTVFAGEEVECRITFKNVASNPPPPRTLLHPPSTNGFAAGGERQRKVPIAQVRSNNNLSPRPPPPAKGHRSSISLNTPVGAGRSPPGVGPGSWTGAHTKASASGSTHKRSVSIISIGASESAADDTASNGTAGGQKMTRAHRRSASLQIMPRRLGLNGPTSAPLAHRFLTQPSPQFPHSTSPQLSQSTSPQLPHSTSPVLDGKPTHRRGASTAPNTPSLRGTTFAKRGSSSPFPQTFRFPPVAPASDEKIIESLPVEERNVHDANSRMLSPRSNDTATIPKVSEHTAIAKVLTPASIAGTPRSSGEFYSLSNNSTETIASEYVVPNSIPPSFGNHIRRPSNLGPTGGHRPPEVLMMGYAQIHGSFTLDGSLISQSPFDDVKRKGAVGGQGGGVIGVDTNRRDSRLLRGFGWGAIGESLGGLLGGGELSSMKDMRGIASSRSIPLLSTPQSILFVDLRLAPGESRSYKYSFALPKGLPPSHRGKAIKISYKLVIGTQRPGGAKEQQVKSVEVPFRILGSVNSHGELLGHDLMSPYIILQDQARIKSIQTSSTMSLDSPKKLKEISITKPSESTLNDFLSYVDELLSRSRQNTAGLLSPTDMRRASRQSYIEEPSTAKEAIDMAILRSNGATEYQQSANRFEIARSGRRVAVVMLARPAYRLGETITAAIDFTGADIPCYAIHASLETSEKVDSSIALRSEASILRATRRVYASHSESTLFARRVVFSPTIPVTATPEFITSGVSLDWRVRIEFVTPRLADADGELRADHAALLEEVSSDDRGTVLAAAEVLDCESFEIEVPITVYGAVAGGAEREEGPLEGLAV